jgi:hypothetical protein
MGSAHNEQLRSAEHSDLALEESDCLRVILETARGKPLIRRVNEGEVALGLDRRADAPPLRRSRVDARRVVGAGVQQDDGATWR